uniref:RING-type E3 ubiquitin transferase n=1 Tax=Elaeis guineensis var. tenera TaxID=51953 RepID=A0A6J0PC31_ELAGV|nr:putative E3 ubiquitin-protein ligase LIN-2 [Elaeis guineensis]
MASLEELLSKEGFKGKTKHGSRGYATSRAVSMPSPRTAHEWNPSFRNPDYRFQRGRARSDVFCRRSQSMWSEDGAIRGGRSENSRMRRETSMDGYEKESLEDSESSECNDFEKFKAFNGRLRAHRANGVKDFKMHECDTIQDRERPRFQNSGKKVQEKQIREYTYDNDLYEDEKMDNARNFGSRPSFNHGLQNRRDDDLENPGTKLSLCDAASRAIISILTGYIRRFFQEENFRASVRHSCATCLGLGLAEKNHQKDGGVFASLADAIDAVERVVKEGRDTGELKKASLKLSVVTGLNSVDLKDKFTSGVPNSLVAACAHLYLGVIYKLHKKNRVSAKHLLQVFCNSPYQARTILLPGLWDRLFLPHFSHLREWYDKEAEFIPRTSSRVKKTKLLGKVYNDILDMGTYQIADYYKEWLMEENGSPALPSIPVPSSSYPRREGSNATDLAVVSSARSPASSQPMVSRRLYESVFSQTKKMEEAEELKGREEEIEEEQFIVHTRSSESPIQEYEEYSPNSVIQTQEDNNTSSQEPKESSNGDEWTTNESCNACKVNDFRVKNPTVECHGIQSSPAILGCACFPYLAPQTKENELTLRKLAQAVFKPQVQMGSVESTGSEVKNSGLLSKNSDRNSAALSSSAESIEDYDDVDRGSFFSSIPKDFMCPLTRQLFKDPVTLETGQTFEGAAIKEWFDQGNRTCPVTGRELKYLSVPVMNFVLKRLIDAWKSERCKNLLIFATQIAENATKQDRKSKDESALYIIEQLLTGFSTEEQMENARHLIALGGLDFLIHRLEQGNLKEKTCVAGLLLCCIKANGCCRSYLALNLKSSCILDLLHSNHFRSRTNAVLLLIELICLERRTAITLFLSGLQTDAIVNTMHALLVHLQTSPPEERVLVAVLLLQFDLVVEPCRYSIYREEALDGITLALNCCSFDQKVIPYSRRALLMLGGYFSSSGEILTEAWLLQQAGYSDGGVEESTLEEAKEKEKWLKNVTLALLHSGKRSFLETLSKCLGYGNPELVRACLATVAWLSHVLLSLPAAGHQLSAFAALIPRLKESIENYEQIEHRVLASIALFNFSKIMECRVLLSFADEVQNPLKNLSDITWTAKQLYATIFGEL